MPWEKAPACPASARTVRSRRGRCKCGRGRRAWRRSGTGTRPSGKIFHGLRGWTQTPVPTGHVLLFQTCPGQIRSKPFTFSSYYGNCCVIKLLRRLYRPQLDALVILVPPDHFLRNARVLREADLARFVDRCGKEVLLA